MSIRCGLAGDMTEKTSLDDLKIDRSGVDDSRSRSWMWILLFILIVTSRENGA